MLACGKVPSTLPVAGLTTSSPYGPAPFSHFPSMKSLSSVYMREPRCYGTIGAWISTFRRARHRRAAYDAVIGAAVDMDGLAGDVTPARPAQKPHHGGDVIRLAALAGDGAVGEMMRWLLRGARPRRVDRARHHAIGGDEAADRGQARGAQSGRPWRSRHGRVIEPICALMPPILMMVPPCFLSAGRQALTPRNAESSVTFITSRHSS